MDIDSRIYVAGGQGGLVGSAIVRLLRKKGYKNIILRTRKELDLLSQASVDEFFKNEKLKYVFLAAAKVGGIMANKTQKAEFIYENLQIQNNVVFSAWKYKVKKLLFLGSSCIYPKFAPQPMNEECLLTGPPEETNDAYAIAKIAGISLCKSFNEQHGTNFISVIPTNIYGVNDNFDLTTAHVIPAITKKFHDTKIRNETSVTLWGTGEAYREFLYVDDLADACIFLMNNYNDSEIINVGTGKDLSIKKLAQFIKTITQFKGKIKWDTSKPDGAPRKLLNVDRLSKLGWKPKISLKMGLEKTYRWFLQHYNA